MAMTVRKKRILGALAFVFLIGALQANKYYKENIAPVNEAQRAVIEVLKDPGSAQFYNIHVHRYNSAVCGEVNAKNAMGGYVGRKRFVYSSNIKKVDIEEPDLDTERLFEKLYWNILCTGT